MILRYLFYVLAVIQLVLGLGYLAIPETLASQYGSMRMDATAAAVARFFGATLLPLAYVSWTAAGAAGSPLKVVIVRAWAVTPVLGLVATFLVYPSGVLGLEGTIVQVVLAGVFLIGFGYYGWVKTEAATT